MTVGIIDTVLGWFEWPVSWVLVQFHSLFSLVFPPTSGWAWGLAIVGLVVVVRAALIPLFVRQIHAQRGLQLLQPQIKEIQKRYKDDRNKQSEELMKLYRETGTNPFSSCLPIIAQMPIFFALFRVINYGIANEQAVGAMTQEQSAQAAQATIFGAPLDASFMSTDQMSVKIVTVVMILAMTASTFFTQRQLMVKNMPSGQDNPMMQQQKILLYVFPLMFAVFGINFPIGVLVYWLTTNLWTAGQQYYVIRRNPAPGSPAYEELQARRAAKETGHGSSDGAVAVEPVTDPAPKPVRQQPKRQPRSKRKTTPGDSGKSGQSGETDENRKEGS
jgi:YidC/Oxa1 family membrane protein insertase